jgi:predicted AlkP superfamily phosphohydrolase/phosphomutase
MRAFALPAFYDARIRINLADRESQGLVAAGDYERVCSEVEELLGALRDPRTGREVVRDIRRPRAGDPMDPQGADADLIVTWTVGADAVRHPELGMVGPYPFRRTGGHTATGFAMVSGPDIEPGDREARQALDLTPTVLSLLGRTAAAPLEGSPFL